MGDKFLLKVKLLEDSGYPGMKVLEFAFDPREETDYLPHSYDRNCVVYTGTHDNETLVQWYKGLDEESKAFAMEYMNNAGTPDEEKYWDFVRLAMMSSANTCITPLQDYLGWIRRLGLINLLLLGETGSGAWIRRCCPMQW